MTKNYFYASKSNQQSSNNNTNDSNELAKSPIFKQLLVFLVGWFGINIISLIIQLIVSLFVKIPDKDLEPVLYQQVRDKILGPMQFSTYVITTAIVIIVLGLPLLKRIFSDFSKVEKIGKGVIYGFVLLGASIIYNLIIQSFYPNLTENENQKAIESMISIYPVLSGIMIVVLAPVLEEITYRFGLFGIGYHKNKCIGFILSSLVFGLIHTNFFGVTEELLIIELLNFPSYVISGFILSYAFYKENSLVPSMTAHAINNLFAFLSSLTATGLVMYVF